MGWLRPEEYLIEDPDFLGKNRPDTPPKYRCVVTVLGELKFASGDHQPFMCMISAV